MYSTSASTSAIAADWIAAEMTRIGLKPGNNGSYCRPGPDHCYSRGSCAALPYKHHLEPDVVR